MILTIILSLHLLWQSVASSLSGPDLVYDVVVGGRRIGQLRVDTVQNALASQLHYRVNSDVKFNIFGERHVLTQMTNTYQDKRLTEASVHERLNGKVRHQARTIWDGKQYAIHINNAALKPPKQSIRFTTVHLYMQEPIGIAEIYSERFGELCELRPVGNHVYELSLPDGRKNRYHYGNGYCKEVEIDQGLFTIYFRLQGVKP